MENSEPIIIYKSYSKAQAKATQKYREANKDKYIENQKKYHEEKKNDPEYRKKRLEASKRYYEKKKNMIIETINEVA